MRIHRRMVVRRQASPGLTGLLVGLILCGFSGKGWGIDIKLSPEEAKKALETGRAPMEKANSA